MPKKKKPLKTNQSNFNPFKPTLNRVLTLAVIIQFGLIGLLGFAFYEWWRFDQNGSNVDFITMIRESNDRLYDISQSESVYRYDEKIIEWPRYGISIPQEISFGEVYLHSWVEEDYRTSEINISNDSARGFVYGGNYVESFEEYLDKTVPMMHSCNRMIIAMPRGEQPSYDGYQKEFAKTFKDGRDYEFYSNNMCNPKDKSEFVEYLKQIDSM